MQRSTNQVRKVLRERRRFEYKTVHSRLQMYESDFNKMGRQGWELVNLNNDGYGRTALYKREVL